MFPIKDIKSLIHKSKVNKLDFIKILKNVAMCDNGG